MKLIPYMIYIDYNHNSDLLVDKSLPINHIIIGDKVKYDYTNNFWYTKNHYRAPIELKDGKSQIKFFQIGFKLLECEYQNVTIQVKSDGPTGGLILTYDEKYDVWFQKSIFQNYKENGKYKFSKRTKDFLRGLNHSGQLSIEVYHGNDKLVSEKILFLPSSIPILQYDLMISDLFRLRESLVRNEKIDVKVNIKKSKTLDKLESFVENIEVPLKFINRYPATSLGIQKDYIKVNSAFRFDPVTEIQKIINPGKSKFKALVKNENLAIYENRLIKQQLEKMLNYSMFFSGDSKIVDVDKTQKMNEAKSIILKSSPRIKREIQIYGGIENLNQYQIEEIDKNINEDIEMKQNEILGRPQEIGSMLERQIQKESDKPYQNRLPIRLKLKVFSNYFEKTAIINSDYVNVTIKSGKIQDNNSPSILFLGYDYYYNNKWHEANSEKYSKFCEIKTEFLFNNELFLLLSVLEEVSHSVDSQENGTNLIIECYVTLEKEIKINLINEDIIGTPSSNPMYNSYRFNINEIFSISSGQKFFSDKIKSDNQLLYKLSQLLLAYDSEVQEREEEIEHLELEKQTLNQISKLIIAKDNISLNGRRYQKLVDNLKGFLNYPLFKGIPTKKYESLRPTQLFMHDPNYKMIWKLLNDIEDEIGASLIPHNKNSQFGVNKVDEIFEIWTLIKMINMLSQEMGWTIVNRNSLIECIDSYLISKKKLKGFYVELELGLWRMELTYEAKINLVGNEYKEPDYTFVLKYKNYWGHYEEVGVIYLDAKYRNYEEQDIANFGEVEWAKDISEFAIDKYGNMQLRDNRYLKTIASFLIHPDIELGMSKETKGENYFAYYNREQFPGELEKQKGENVHKYGSIYLLPTSTHSFKNWFRMIMEYKLDNYQKCWSCGEQTNILKTIKFTGKGYPKYYYQCQECNEFWVKNHCSQRGHKLIKHVNNYHRQPSSEYEWYVVCPTCGDGYQFEKTKPKLKPKYSIPLSFDIPFFPG